MILGTISAVDDDNGLQLIIDGEDEPTTKKYTYMASYVPTANDRVLIEEISGSYVIMGKVISDKDLSGVARTAESATIAASCSGNAATATLSDKTKGFDDSVNTTQGMLVTGVTREYNSTLGTYIVTDVQTSYFQRNYVYK